MISLRIIWQSQDVDPCLQFIVSELEQKGKCSPAALAEEMRQMLEDAS